MGTSDENADATTPRNTSEKSSRLFTAVFIAIIGVTLCCFITGQGLNAGTSVYIDRLGGSATLAGIGAAVFSFSAIAGRIVSGPLADMRGRLVVIVAGAITLLVGVFGSAFSADLDIIMIWRALQGLGFSAVTTATATAAADVLPAERLGEGIGYYGLGQAIAMSIGPALAIALVSTDPPENLFWGLSIAATVSLALCVFCRYEKNPERLPETATYRRLALEKRKRADGNAENAASSDNADNYGGNETERSSENDGGINADAHGCSGNENGARDNGTDSSDDNHGSNGGDRSSQDRKGFISKFAEPGALAGGIPMMVLSPAFGFGIYFVGLLGTNLGIGNAGIFYTISAIAMIIVRLSSKAFMDRVVAIKLFAIAIVAGIVCFSLLVSVTLSPAIGFAESALFYTAGIFYGLCLGIALPVNQTVAVKNSPPERWGAANGLFMLLFDIGIGIASIVWGITNDQMGFSFTVGCVIVFIVAAFFTALATYPPSAKAWKS